MKVKTKDGSTTVEEIAIREHANGGFTIATRGRMTGEMNDVVAACSGSFRLLSELAEMTGTAATFTIPEGE